MFNKIKAYSIILFLAMSGSIHAFEEGRYIYDIQEAAKHHNDIYIYPYVGVSTSSFMNPYLGLNVQAVNLKFLPFVYFNGSFEVFSNIGLGFNAQLGAVFGGLKNMEHKIIVKSYSGGYRTTINEYIPVYIPVQYSWFVFANARREQMSAYSVNGMVENAPFSTPPENGAMFYGVGVGIFTVADYKVHVTKGSDFDRMYDHKSSANVSLSLLYSPDDGLYQGFAGAMDLTAHYKIFSMTFGLIYSFAPFQESAFLDKMIVKFALGIHFGIKTKPDPVFDVNCTATGKPVEECMSK